MTQQVDTHRELLFLVSEVDETRDLEYIMGRIIMSYEGGVIDEREKILLFGTLYRNCGYYGVMGGDDILDYIDRWMEVQEDDLPF
jgi:hypothetical protein